MVDWRGLAGIREKEERPRKWDGEPASFWGGAERWRRVR